MNTVTPFMTKFQNLHLERDQLPEVSICESSLVERMLSDVNDFAANYTFEEVRWNKYWWGKCEIYLRHSPLPLSTPTKQSSFVPGLVDGLGIVLVRRDKAMMIVTLYFKRNFPPGN